MDKCSRTITLKQLAVLLAGMVFSSVHAEENAFIGDNASVSDKLYQGEQLSQLRPSSNSNQGLRTQQIDSQPAEVVPVEAGSGVSQSAHVTPVQHESQVAQNKVSNYSAKKVEPKVVTQGAVQRRVYLVNPSLLQGHVPLPVEQKPIQEATPTGGQAQAGSAGLSIETQRAMAAQKWKGQSDSGEAGGITPLTPSEGLMCTNTHAQQQKYRWKIANKPKLEQGQMELVADDVKGADLGTIFANGQAEFYSGSKQIYADQIAYNQLTDDAEAVGNALLVDNKNIISGPNAELNINTKEGQIEHPYYELAATKKYDFGTRIENFTVYGKAQKMNLKGENQYQFNRSSWSTCEADDPDWYIKSHDMSLDYDRNRGTVRNARLIFKGVPILYVPKFSFPLTAERQSGLLTPSIDISNTKGTEVTVPYYWNIAPNYDATIYSKYSSRRGPQIGADYRYLTSRSQGTLSAEMLPHDRVYGDQRRLFSWTHFQQLTNRLTAEVDYGYVSDAQYFEDLSTNVETSSTSNLKRWGKLNYQGDDWYASIEGEGYQNLRSAPSYKRFPRIQAGTSMGLPLGVSLNMPVEFTHFTIPSHNSPNVKRYVFNPKLTKNFIYPGYYFKPALTLHYTHYDLTKPLELQGEARGHYKARTSISRTIPILSLDTGMEFDRDLSLLGRNYTQTLEPRLFYVYAPYRRQNDIPLLDSAPYDFGIIQMFQENRFTGVDRISDSNQLTAALTSRLINPSNGVEEGRVMVAQRFYFKKPKVSFSADDSGQPYDVPRKGRRSHWLAGAQGRLLPSVFVDTLWEYDPDKSRTVRSKARLSYHRQNGEVYNIGYRDYRAPGWKRGKEYARTQQDYYLRRYVSAVRDVEASAQFPLASRFSGIVRGVHSVLEKRTTEVLGGFEYEGQCGCWVLRTAVQRYARNFNSYTNSFFVQLELKGLGGLGKDPTNILRKSVQGYRRMDEEWSNVDTPDMFWSNYQ